MLSQVCRDPNDSLYGCFDRNFWHYKIRDFASIILQQGGYFCHTLSQLDAFREHASHLEEMARAAAVFWNQRAKRKGAFEEYYPWEKGYPPMAFSALAMAKLVYEGPVGKEEVESGLRIARKQLEGRFESRAANQQMAGLAALAFLDKINPDPATQASYHRLKARTMALQDPEGWFAEYDGPDLGYLSVTLDCLWDLYDLTKDEDYIESIRRAVRFLHPLTRFFRGNAGMHNARNTDYIVPYGIVRAMFHTDREMVSLAGEIFQNLYLDHASPDHFFHAIDDRYLVHYIGHSIARAEKVLNRGEETQSGLPDPSGQDRDFPNAGYHIRYGSADRPDVFVSIRKGGILSGISGSRDKYYHDFGWILEGKGKQYISHWWSDDWEGNLEAGSGEISGFFVPHREKQNTPGRHFMLRVLSFVFGQNIIAFLKSQLIFKNRKSRIRFIRKISLEERGILFLSCFIDFYSRPCVEVFRMERVCA